MQIIFWRTRERGVRIKKNRFLQPEVAPKTQVVPYFFEIRNDEVKTRKFESPTKFLYF